MPAVGLLILAAGASTRMGDTPKQLLPYGNSTLLRHAAQTALASRCRPVLVIIGAHAERVQSEVADLPVQSVFCERWQQGMGASIRIGVAALAASECVISGVILTLADMPLLSATHFDRFADSARISPDRIIAAEYSGTLGVPAFFPASVFPQLIALPEGAGAKSLFQHNEVIHMLLPEAAVDIDTPGDYAAL